MEAQSKQKVFITGITGFSGMHLEKRLSELGYEVYGSTYLESNKTNHFRCNILFKNELRSVLDRTRPNYVIHLAAISFVASENINQMYETNIQGTLNILDVLEELKIGAKKILIASSAAVYGNIGSILSEDMCPKPVNHYGNSKLAMENMVANYYDKLNIIIARPFNYTGIGQGSEFLVPKIVDHFKDKKEVIELGNLNTYREYNDIRFTCQIYIDLLEVDYISGILNISSSKTYSIQDILNEMSILSSYSIKVEVNPRFVRKNEINELRGSTKKLKDVLRKDFKSYSLKETLREMYTN